MTIILTAIFCLRGLCIVEVVPTPISFSMEECGQLSSKPSHGQWQFVAWTCEEGRYV